MNIIKRNFFNVVLLISSTLIPLVVSSNEDAEEYMKKIWEQIQLCDEARNNIGSEMQYVTLSGLQDIGENDCQIVLTFRTIEDMAKFKKSRVNKKLDPEIVAYKGRNIKLSMDIGEGCEP